MESKLLSKEFNREVKYDDLKNMFWSALDRYDLLKQKQVRENQVPFLTKELSKAIMTRSRIKNKCNKWPSRQNFVGHKQIKNKCTNLIKIATKQYFAKYTENQPLTNRNFWNSILPFLTNKNVRNDDIITLKKKRTSYKWWALIFGNFKLTLYRRLVDNLHSH